MDIYSQPDLYDAIHDEYIWDINLIKAYAKKNQGSVLELASGTGRLTQCIIDLGLAYTGLEKNSDLVKFSQAKFDKRANFILANMQKFKINKLFDFVFIGFNSFLHNLTKEKAQNCLNCVYNHLKPSGKFLISSFIPHPSFLYRDNKKLYPATNFFYYKGKTCRILEKNEYFVDSQINNLYWFLEKDGEISDTQFTFSLRMYYPHEMDILLSKSGFKILEKIGDYDGSKMDEFSSMQIYLCEKQ